MADGLATANADSALGTITASAAYIALATGPPGSAGTANPSSVTTREAVTWGSASAGSIASTGTAPEWTSWAGSNAEVVTDIAFWSLVTSGTFELSMPLDSGVTMDTGDSLTLTSITITIPTAS